MGRFLRESHMKILPEGEVKHHFISIRARTQKLLCKTIWQTVQSRDFELRAQLWLHFHPFIPPTFCLSDLNPEKWVTFQSKVWCKLRFCFSRVELGQGRNLGTGHTASVYCRTWKPEMSHKMKLRFGSLRHFTAPTYQICGPDTI